jgi:hypothetical protein
MRMVYREPSQESVTTYEIRLQGAPPPLTLHEQFPSIEMLTRRPETLLFRRVDDLAELDALLDQILSMGLVLTEVHELPVTSIARPEGHHGSDASPQTGWYEVRVEGELGEPLLRYLNWSHRVVPEQTYMKVEATSSELDAILSVCAEEGTTIERVRRVRPSRWCFHSREVSSLHS